MDNFEQTPKKSSNSRIFLIIGGIILAICCVGALCVGGITMAAFGAIRSSDVYIETIATATTDTEVNNVLGSPITPGFLMSGSINVEGNSGDADFSIPLEGANQSGTLYVVATKQGGTWQYSQFYVEAADGTRIDLNR
jgi:hypothetical protein